MHAADAAGGENGDACHVGDHHGGGDGGSAVLTPGAQQCQVPAGSLVNGLALLAEVFNFFRSQTGLQPTADDGDGGGNGAVFPDNPLHVQSGFHILGIGHTVGNDGGFQGNDGLALGNGGGNFGIDVQILVQFHTNHIPLLRLKVQPFIRAFSAWADMAGLMVSADSMAMAPAARPARAVASRSLPSR